MRLSNGGKTEEEEEEEEEENPNEVPPIKSPTPVPLTLKPADREATVSQTSAGNLTFQPFSPRPPRYFLYLRFLLYLFPR